MQAAKGSACCVLMCVFALARALPGVPIPETFQHEEQHPQSQDLGGLFRDVCTGDVGRVPGLRKINNPADLCEGKWIDVRQVGNFTSEDFKIFEPKRMRRTGNGPTDFEYVPPQRFTEAAEQYCLISVKHGFADERGKSFNCEAQYPMADSMLLDENDQTVRGAPGGSVRKYKKLYTVTLFWNFAFSHTFTQGITTAIWAFHSIASDPSAVVLVPATGPFKKLLESLGIPGNKVVTIDKGWVYAEEVVLIAPKAPFYLPHCHWPRNSLLPTSEKLRSYLRAQGIDDTNQNLVVYAWRPGGSRTVDAQDRLVQTIQKSLKPGYELAVYGREGGKIGYESSQAAVSWLKAAELFTRARAVIGPHGGAFGNLLLCHPNTLIVEFNIEWDMPVNGNQAFRDIFHAAANTAGLNNYWVVHPMNLPRTSFKMQERGEVKKLFYENHSPMRVDHDQIVAILRHEGLAV